MNIIIGNKVSQVAQINFKNTDRTAAKARAVRRYSNNAVKKSKKKSNSKQSKKLNYNFKEISTKLLQTKTSGTAGRVMILARSRAALLRQKLASGYYNRGELTSAIIHADSMVRAAKKRMKHLKMEEEAERNAKTPVEEAEEREEVLDFTPYSDDLSAEQEAMQDIARETEQELARELQRLMEEAMREAMQEAGKAMEDTLELAELSGELEGAMDEMEPADLEQLKKKHRAEELREIMEADMKYLKAMFDRLAKEKQSNGAGAFEGGGDSVPEAAAPDMAAVSLELNGVDMPVPDTVPAGDSVGGSVDVAI